MLRILKFLLLLLVFSSPLLAQTTGQVEMVTVPKSALTADQLAQVEQRNLQDKISTYGKWVGLGKEVGEAVNSSLSALTSQADNFAKTGVGKFTLFMVAWKVLGSDIMDIVIAVPIMMLLTSLFIWSYRKSCTTRSVLVGVQADGAKSYEIVNRSDGRDPDNDLDARRGWHWAIYLICMAILVGVAL